MYYTPSIVVWGGLSNCRRKSLTTVHSSWRCLPHFAPPPLAFMPSSSVQILTCVRAPTHIGVPNRIWVPTRVPVPIRLWVLDRVGLPIRIPFLTQIQMLIGFKPHFHSSPIFIHVQHNRRPPWFRSSSTHAHEHSTWHNHALNKDHWHNST